MKISELMAFRQAQPFRPYTIHTTDGRSFYVPQPEFVSRSPSGRTVVVNYDEERLAILDISLVASIQLGRRLKPKPESPRGRRHG